MRETFGVETLSPEIAHKDKSQEVISSEIIAKTFSELLNQGLFDKQSLAEAEAKLFKEFLNADIIPIEQEEVQELPTEVEKIQELEEKT